MKLCAWVAVGLLLWPALGGAQSLPKPAEFYFDADESVARPIVVMVGDDDATVSALVRRMEREGRDAGRAAAQLARIAMAGGRTDTGRALYGRALDAYGSAGPARSAVAWNYGWDLYRAGDVDAALAQWTDALSGRLAKPQWAPPTLALALWRLDRKAEAVAWYAAAVRTQPARWSRRDQLPSLLPDWRDDERRVLAEVLDAWAANPPAWP